MNGYTEIAKCRVCGNPNLDSILDLGTQALTGIFPKAADQQVPVAPLQLVKCADKDDANACGLVQLKHSCNPTLMYGSNYGYRSGLNASMVAHLQAKAEKIRGTASLPPGSMILDIGSNDSTLLRALDEPGLQMVGMDPTGEKFREFYPPHIHLIPDFFSASRFRREFGHRRANVITSIAMFYDLEDPQAFVHQVAETLADNGIWVFEQSYLPLMLGRTSYDTICHEHVEYYSLKQIRYLLDRAELKIISVEKNQVNGGSFSVTAAHRSSTGLEPDSSVPEAFAEEAGQELAGGNIYAQFRERVFAQREALCRLLRNWSETGRKLFGYGASTKGNVILQFCGISSKDIPFIADVNPDKFGCFTPQTLIPIISEEQARARKPDGYLVLPWHFREHILVREKNFLAAGGALVFPLPQIEVVLKP